MFEKLNQKGQSMFEVLVALGIMALILTAVASLATKSISNSGFSRNETLANRYTQEAIEWVRSERDNQGYDFVRGKANNTGLTWCLTTTAWPGTSGNCGSSDFVSGTNIFIRELTLTRDDASDEVQVSVEVSWDEGNKTFTVQNETVLADLRSQ